MLKCSQLQSIISACPASTYLAPDQLPRLQMSPTKVALIYSTAEEKLMGTYFPQDQNQTRIHANAGDWQTHSIGKLTPCAESKQIKLFLARAEIRKPKHLFSAKSLILGLPIKTSIPIKPRGSWIPIDPKYPKDLSDQVFSLSLGCTCRVAGALDGIGWHSIFISRASQGKHGRCTNAFFERPPVFT